MQLYQETQHFPLFKTKKDHLNMEDHIYLKQVNK